MNQGKISLLDDILFCVAYGLFISGMICGQTLLPVSPLIRHFTIGLGCVLLLVKMFIDFLEHPKLSNHRIMVYFLFLVMIILAGLSVKNNSEYEILGSVIFIFGAYGVNFKSVLKTFVLITTSILLIMLVAYLLGAIGDGTVQRTASSGRARITFGYRSATDLVQLVAYVLLADIVLWFEKKDIIWWRIVLYLILGTVGWIFTDSRLASFSIYVLIPVLLILKYANLDPANKIIGTFLEYLFEICLLVSVVIENMFMTHSYAILNSFDAFSSARLTNTEIGIKLFGYTLFGQNIYTRILQYWSKWFYIDSSYYTFLIEYGIALLLFVAAMYTITVRKELREGNMAISIAFGIICLDSLICREYFLIEYNVFLLAFLANTDDFAQNNIDRKSLFLRYNN